LSGLEKSLTIFIEYYLGTKPDRSASAPFAQVHIHIIVMVAAVLRTQVIFGSFRM